MSIKNLIKEREQKVIKDFFKMKDFEVPTLPNDIDNEVVYYWRSLDFDLHYLPKFSLDEDLDLPLWKDRPHKVFYKKIEVGAINQEAKILPGRWILIDGKNKPHKEVLWVNKNNFWLLEKVGLNLKNYFKKMTKQIHQNDYLINVLNKKGFGSRFCLSPNDIIGLKPYIADILKIKNKIIRLPRFIEYNYLGNTFYKQWATTDTWEWFEDKFDGDKNLTGGYKSVGCLGWDQPDFWSTILSFRPAIEL